MVKLRNLTKKFKLSKKEELLVLNNITADFGNKGMTFILGKSGSGKSTLLNILGGLDQADSGHLNILNKDLNDFSVAEMDFYRNTYVGMVFQESNLLPDYTVYDNIKLSLELGQKSINPEEISELMKELEILELKDRWINELSGGQKQRVAIARALIKNPLIILADEPTGNLDSKTGNQVLEILKKFSKNKLVIVVSHDRKSAFNFGDRIIEIEDGNIINDIDNNTSLKKDEIVEYNPVKSKLSFINSFRLGYNSLKHKKVKLFFTILLSSIAILFMGLSYTLFNYKLEKGYAELMIDENIDYVQIRKNKPKNNNISSVYDYANQNVLELKNSDISMINQETDRIGIPVYELTTNNNLSILELLNINKKSELGSRNDSHYFGLSGIIELVEISSDLESLNQPILGKTPENYNEIMISNYIADFIIEYGIYDYTDETQKEVYYPTSYNELIFSNKLFSFGDLPKIKIVGIVDYDLSQYQDLRKVNETINPDNKISLGRKANGIYNKIFVKEGFVESNSQYKTTTLSSGNYYDFKIDNNSTNIVGFSHGYSYFKLPVDYFDGVNWRTINKLETNEVLLHYSQIPNFDYNEYNIELNNHLKNTPLLNHFEEEKAFLKNYLTNYQIIGKKIEFNIYENIPSNSLIITGNPTVIYDNLDIIGIVGLSDNKVQSYLSLDLVRDYQESVFKTTSLIIPLADKKDFEEIFKMYPYHREYTAVTPFHMDILLYLNQIELYHKLSMYMGSILLLFTIILISNFMFTSIDYRKKDIGILRSMGARTFDIIKIFVWEGIIMALISALIGVGLFVWIGTILNNTVMSNSLNISLKPFLVGNQELIMIGFVSIIVFLVSTVIPLMKISKMKPIDLILKH